MKTHQDEDEQDDLEELRKAEQALMTEEELRKSLKKPLPAWAWLFPVLFMVLGGIGSFIAFRKRRHAGWLLGLGIIMQVINGVIYNMLYAGY